MKLGRNGRILISLLPTVPCSKTQRISLNGAEMSGKSHGFDLTRSQKKLNSSKTKMEMQSKAHLEKVGSLVLSLSSLHMVICSRSSSWKHLISIPADLWLFSSSRMENGNKSSSILCCHMIQSQNRYYLHIALHPLSSGYLSWKKLTRSYMGATRKSVMGRF